MYDLENDRDDLIANLKPIWGEVREAGPGFDVGTRVFGERRFISACMAELTDPEIARFALANNGRAWVNDRPWAPRTMVEFDTALQALVFEARVLKCGQVRKVYRKTLADNPMIEDEMKRYRYGCSDAALRRLASVLRLAA